MNYVNVQSPPASTAVEVRKLARDEWLIEIEAVAVIPESFSGMTSTSVWWCAGR
jgi:hypothetical protein